MIEIIIGIIVGLIAAEIIYWKNLLSIDSEGQWKYLFFEKFFSICFGSFIGIAAGLIVYGIKVFGIQLLLPGFFIIGLVVLIVVNMVLKHYYITKTKGKK